MSYNHSSAQQAPNISAQTCTEFSLAMLAAGPWQADLVEAALGEDPLQQDSRVRLESNYSDCVTADEESSACLAGAALHPNTTRVPAQHSTAM